MRTKYFMSKEWDDDLLIGLTYDSDKRKVTVGGSCRFVAEMSVVLENFRVGEGGSGHAEIIRHRGSHRTKLYLEGIDQEAWEEGIAALGAVQWQLRETRSFRRLMT